MKLIYCTAEYTLHECIFRSTIYEFHIYSSHIFSIYEYVTNSQVASSHTGKLTSWLDCSVGKSAAPVSQRSWVRVPFKPEVLFQACFSQPLRVARGYLLD